MFGTLRRAVGVASSKANSGEARARMDDDAQQLARLDL
jgi:hypothetical protein